MTNTFQVAARRATILLAVIASTTLMSLEKKTCGQGRTDTAAVTGDASPDGNGSLGDFVELRIGNQGQVGFVSRNMTGTSGGTADDQAVFVLGKSSLTQLFREGHAAPANGNYGDTFALSEFNQTGQLAVISYGMTGTTGGTTDNNAVFLNDGFTTVEKARMGDPAGINGKLGLVDFPLLNDSGQVAFQTRNMSSTSGGTSDDKGIFFHNGTSLLEVARESDAAPGGGQFGHVGDLGYDLNELGEVVFRAPLTGTTATEGVFMNSGGVVSQIAREGQAADGNGKFGRFFYIRNNDLGQVSFLGHSITSSLGGTADNEGIFIHDGTSISTVARKGNAAPSNGNFGRFNLTLLNNAGQMVFQSLDMTGTAGGTSDDSGIFLYDGSAIVEIARKGSAAPKDGNFGWFGTTRFNDFGQVVFRSAAMTGTTGGLADDEGIFISDGVETVEVARSGGIINGHTVDSLNETMINDLGQVAYYAYLSSGDQVVQRWTPDLRWRSTSSGFWDDRTNFTLSIQPNFVHDVYLDSNFDVTIAGPTSDTFLRQLVIGGGAGESTLILQTGTTLTSEMGVTIAQTGSLTGQGTIVGDTVSDGRIFADQLVFADNLSLDPNSQILVPIGGIDPGAYGQVFVGSNLHIDGDLVVGLINAHTLSLNEEYLIMDVGAVQTGQFDGLAEGDLVGTFGGMNLFISYVGGDGNDVVLYTSAVPEPSAAVFAFLLVATLVLGTRRRRRFES